MHTSHPYSLDIRNLTAQPTLFLFALLGLQFASNQLIILSHSSNFELLFLSSNTMSLLSKLSPNLSSRVMLKTSLKILYFSEILVSRCAFRIASHILHSKNSFATYSLFCAVVG